MLTLTLGVNTALVSVTYHNEKDVPVEVAGPAGGSTGDGQGGVTAVRTRVFLSHHFPRHLYVFV